MFCILSLYFEVLTSLYKYYQAESLYLCPCHSLLVNIKFCKIHVLVLCLVSFFLKQCFGDMFLVYEKEKNLWPHPCRTFQGCFTLCEVLPTALSGSVHITAWNCNCQLFLVKLEYFLFLTPGETDSHLNIKFSCVGTLNNSSCLGNKGVQISFEDKNSMYMYNIMLNEY